MIIGIDGNEANIKNRVGVNVFAFEILKALYNLRPSNVSFRIFLNKSSIADMPESQDYWQYEVFGPSKFWTLTGLPTRLYLGKPRPDVLFSPSHYGPLLSPTPFIISIMDLGFLRWPDQFTKKDLWQLRYFTKLSAQKAKKIITISEFSKQDIVETYQLPESKVDVAYPGVTSNQQPATSIQKELFKLKDKYKINSDYFLFIGTLKPSKNIERLIKAFDMLVKLPASGIRHPVKNLVVAGKKGWLYEDIFKLVKELKLENKVKFLGYITNCEEQALLKNAKAFILPSLWEGFGLPVLEAMQAGTPVICSKIASLPEVGGNAVVYIKNPNSVDSIYKSMNKMIKLDSSERKKLINLGYKQAEKFNWCMSAKKIINTLKSL